MDNSEYNDIDVKVNHSVGCQLFYIVIGVLMAIIASICIYEVGDGKWYNRFILAPLLLVFSIYAVYQLSYSLIKERINKIPAYIITRNSLIVSRKKNEYNEIPFDVIEQFKRRRVRTRRNSHTTYIDICYKSDVPETSTKFEIIDKIDCSGLTMRSDKLLNLLCERLSKHNEKALQQNTNN